MQQTIRKLKSTRGASLLFALLVFVLCLLAGTVALTAAAANVGRYTHLQQEQQQYLSVASALDLLEAQMKTAAGARKVKVQYVDIERWHYESSTPGSTPTLVTEHTYSLTLVDPEDPTAAPPDVGTLNYFQCQMLLASVPADWWTATGPLKKAAVEAQLTTFNTDPELGSYTVKLSDAHKDEPWAGTLYPVKATVQKPTPTAAGDVSAFELKMELAAQADDGSGAGTTIPVYPLTVVWPGEVTTDIATTVTTSGDPGTGGTPGVGDNSSGTRTTTQTLTCTLQWDAADRVFTLG